MTRTFGPDNAIGWVQVRLRGGPRTLLTTSATYGAVIVAAMIASVRMADRSPLSTVFQGWAAGLMGLQAAILLLFAPTRIAAAVRQDLSGMIESHRLMPVAPFQAIIGYLFGSTTQALALGVVNLVLGGYAAVQAGVQAQHWLGANAVLFTFAVFVWVIITYAAFLMRTQIGLLFFMPLMFLGGRGGALALTPGLTILATPLLGASVFDMTATLKGLSEALLLAFTGQIVVGLLFFAAATRKYRRGDVIGFTPALGLALLASWVALSLLGTAKWEVVAPRFMFTYWVKADGQLITSLVIAMLLALVPLWAAADQHAAWLSRKLLGDVSLPKRPPMPGWLLIVATVVIILPLVALADRLRIANFPQRTLPLVALVVLFHVVSSNYLRRALRFYTEKANALFACWLGVVWGAPMLIDLIRSELEGVPTDPTFGPISCISPVGTMLALANDRIKEVPMGLIAQGGLTLLVLLFYFQTHPLRRRRRARAVNSAA
jgi:hypothetical protein